MEHICLGGEVKWGEKWQTSKEIQIIYKFGQIRKGILEQLETIQNNDL